MFWNPAKNGHRLYQPKVYTRNHYVQWPVMALTFNLRSWGLNLKHHLLAVIKYTKLFRNPMMHNKVMDQTWTTSNFEKKHTYKHMQTWTGVTLNSPYHYHSMGLRKNTPVLAVALSHEMVDEYLKCIYIISYVSWKKKKQKGFVHICIASECLNFTVQRESCLCHIHLLHHDICLFDLK